MARAKALKLLIKMKIVVQAQVHEAGSGDCAECRAAPNLRAIFSEFGGHNSNTIQNPLNSEPTS